MIVGSGGRDLSGNKRTNKEQGCDQELTAFNKALQLSCTKGYPVRVVRSYKDKHSQYAPARLIKDPPPTRPGAAAPLARGRRGRGRGGAGCGGGTHGERLEGDDTARRGGLGAIALGHIRPCAVQLGSECQPPQEEVADLAGAF